MKTPALLSFLACAATANALHAETPLSVSVKLIEAPSSVKVTEDIGALNNGKGVSLISAPQITANSGKKCAVSISRDFAIKGQDPIPVGFEMEITPTAKAEGISYSARYKTTELLGIFADKNDQKEPVFQTITIPLEGDLRSGVAKIIEIHDSVDQGHGDKSKKYLYLTIKKDSTGGEPDHASKAAKNMIIPAVRFHGVSAQDAVAYLNMKCKELNPDKQSVNTVLSHPSDESKTITLELNNASLLDILRAVAVQAGLEVQPSGNMIILAPKHA